MNNFTTTFIKSLKPKNSPYEVSDAGCRGLRVQVTKAGSKIFRTTVRINSKRKIFTIGHYPDVSLADARAKTLEIKAGARQGTLETDKDKKAREQAESEAVIEAELKEQTTMDSLLRVFEDTVISLRRRPEAALQIINSDLRGKGLNHSGIVLATMPVKSITTFHVQEFIRNIISRGAVHHAGETLALVKQFFQWCEVGGHCSNPTASLSKKYFGIPKINKIEHLLDIDDNGNAVKGLPEINNLFSILDDYPVEIRNGLKLLLLLGVRSRELWLAKPKDIKGDFWIIPAENTKTLTGITIPLNSHTKKLFKELFTNGMPVAAGKWPYHMKRICTKYNLPKTTPHTLRKTLRSHIAPYTRHEVAEKCLNHQLGGVYAVYQKNSFLEERRVALNRWTDDVYGKSNILRLAS